MWRLTQVVDGASGSSMNGQHLLNICLLVLSGGEDVDFLLNFVDRELGHFVLHHASIVVIPREVLLSQELLEKIHRVEEFGGQVSNGAYWCHIWANGKRRNWYS